MTTFSSASIEALLIEVIFVLLILRRQYAIYRGTRVPSYPVTVNMGLILLLFALLELSAYYALGATFPGLGWAALANLAILAAAAVVFTRYTETQAHVWKAPNGVWMYQLGIVPAIVYVALYFVRLGLEFVFFPSLLDFVPGVPASPSTVLQLAVLEAVAALFAVSSGMLVGRGLGVYRRYVDLKKAEDREQPLRSTPPAGGPGSDDL